MLINLKIMPYENTHIDLLAIIIDLRTQLFERQLALTWVKF